MSQMPGRLMARTAVAAVLVAQLATQAAAFDTKARAAFVLDQTTNTVLLAKEADVAVPPASMSKLMTLYIAFEALRDGRLSMDEELRVSQHAMDYQGSTLFLRAGERVKVEDLLLGIIVLSGNDACAVIAEALSPDGTEAGFARMMTTRAHQLGMTQSVFKNSNGWPAEGHVMSMHDLVTLAQHIIQDFPEYYPMFAREEFIFDENEAKNRFNRNPLLGLGIGADGLKTGHTQEAGYGLVGSAQQGDRRIIFALSGMDTERTRSEESESIVNWAFRQFGEQTIATEGTAIATADVFMGEADTVGLTAEGDLTLLLPISPINGLEAEVVYTGPIRAPIAKGQQLAELIVRPEGLPEIRVPLHAAEAVAPAGFFRRMVAVSKALVSRIGEDTPAEAS